VLQTPTEGAALRDGAATAASVPTAVAASDVTRRYGSGEAAVDALRGVSIEVPRGQFAAIMGPSGSGKSTLMHVLAGLDTPTSGTVHIAGEDITRMNDAQLTKLRRAHIGFVFQAFNLLPTLSAEENILLPLQLAGRKVDQEWFQAVVERVGLADRTKHRPSELSGGQQQRVAVARALVSEPTVLFADEPTGNLDSRSSHDVLELLRDAAVSFGQTTVMVTHDPGAAAAADRVVFLADGNIAGDLRDPDEATILEGIHEATR
jgi:putative ABC transport system ATP-binding protein